ncbi:MAG: hypothetical protein GY938_16675 [Ketobacter sp.]|nr:hypothetical protein [Ketobacter sp.]
MNDPKIMVDSIDVNETDFRHFVWCSKDGINDGTANDTGVLGGATIASHEVTLAKGNITIVSTNANAVTIRHTDETAVTYAADVAINVLLSAATGAEQIELLCRIVTTDGRTLDQTMIVPIEEH